MTCCPAALVRHGELGISVACWAALAACELRARTPFLDLRLLAANKALTRTYLRFGLVLLCVYVVLYGITQWVEGVRGLSATEAGLLLLPMTLTGGLVILPVSRRNLVRGPVIAAAGNQTALYNQAPPSSSAPRPGCCAPSATSAPSPPPPSPASSSTPASPTTAFTSSRGS